MVNCLKYDNIISGIYTVRDNAIEFTIKEDDFIIRENFRGEIQENALLLNWKQKKTSRKVHADLFSFTAVNKYAE